MQVCARPHIWHVQYSTGEMANRKRRNYPRRRKHTQSEIPIHRERRQSVKKIQRHVLLVCSTWQNSHMILKNLSFCTLLAMCIGVCVCFDVLFTYFIRYRITGISLYFQKLSKQYCATAMFLFCVNARAQLWHVSFPQILVLFKCVARVFCSLSLYLVLFDIDNSRSWYNRISITKARHCVCVCVCMFCCVLMLVCVPVTGSPEKCSPACATTISTYSFYSLTHTRRCACLCAFIHFVVVSYNRQKDITYLYSRLKVILKLNLISMHTHKRIWTLIVLI